MFVVAKMDFFNNDLVQELFDFDGSLYEAYLRQYIWDFSPTLEALSEIDSIDQIKNYYFDADRVINIMELK